MGTKKPIIVLPLDGSKTATTALGAAQAVTKILDGVLYIVHVAESHVPEGQFKEYLKLDGIELDRCLLEQLEGEPVESILAFASKIEAKMIVMASHGKTYNHGRSIGEVTMGIIQKTKIPIMLICSDLENLPAKDWKPVRMLCPLDGSPMASAEMKRVFSIARLLGAEIDILNVAVHGKRSVEAGTITTHEYEDYPQHDLPAWVDEFVRRCCEARPPDVEISMFQLAGEPVRTMVEFSARNNDDLIVLTWKGQLGADRAQTVKGLLKTTKVPILLAKTKSE